MTGVYIKTRTAKSGKRFLVYYRRGGRGFPEEYGGSFTTSKEAKIRRDLIAGELAAGRDPRILLDQVKKPPPPPPGLEQRWNEFMVSRVDVGAKTQAQYRNARDRWLPILGAQRDPHTITAADIAAGIAVLHDGGEGLASSSIGQYVSNLAMVLDFCDIEPNPARSSKVKLPATDRPEKAIPTNDQWQAILAKIRTRSVRPIRLMEACGLRVSEAASLAEGDVDLVEGMLRIRREATKTAAGRRWVPVPPDLLDAIAVRLPALEDRDATNSLFSVTSSEIYYDLRRACTLAGVPEFGTHALRHRRISLWLRHGIDAVQVSRWSGHSKPSESTDTYGHTIADPRDDEWRDFWVETYTAGRSRAARVRHDEVVEP